MEPKFVTGFLTPRVVVRGESLESYGVCFGARRFDDGSFALLEENGVTLYDRSGHKTDGFLDDVFVFKNGFVLKKKRKGQNWTFETPQGTVIAMADKAEIAGGNWLALRVQGQEWNVYRVLGLCFERQISVSLFSKRWQVFARLCTEDLKIYQGSGTGSLVFALSDGDMSVLQRRDAVFGNIKAELTRRGRYLCLPNGGFALSDAVFRPVWHKSDCLWTKRFSGGEIDLYDERLQLCGEGLSDIIMFKNGMSFRQFGTEWKLVAADGTILETNVFDLQLYEAEQDIPCILFGSSERNEHIIVRFFENGWLHFSRSGNGSFLTPEGKRIEAPNGTCVPFVV